MRGPQYSLYTAYTLLSVQACLQRGNEGAKQALKGQVVVTEPWVSCQSGRP